MPQRNLAVELLQKAAKGRDQSAREAQRRPGAFLRRPAGAGGAQVPEPRDRDGAGDRGTDSARERHARRQRARRGAEAERRTSLAFYDALEVNDSAVKVLGEPTLVDIARELVETVKKNVTIDWTLRENVRKPNYVSS